MGGLSLGTILILGFVLGLRHACDADHIAAVAAIAPGRGGLRRSLATGLSWGVGHALVLALVGGLLLALRLTVPERLERLFELLVGVMLVGLGVSAIISALRERIHAHTHEHDGVLHAHLHVHARPVPHAAAAPHRHPHPLRPALRPFLIGTLHGLAGSGAIVLLILAAMPGLLAGYLYLGLFGTGSIAGMAVMRIVLGAPLEIARRRASWIYHAFRGAAGVGSLGLGLLLIVQNGPGAGLFR